MAKVVTNIGEVVTNGIEVVNKIIRGGEHHFGILQKTKCRVTTCATSQEFFEKRSSFAPSAVNLRMLLLL